MTLPSARTRRAKVALRTADFAFPKAISPAKTKHGRREREWGRMAYAHSLGWCDVAMAYAEEFGVDVNRWAVPIGPCRGRLEYMHLHLEEGAGRRRAPDHQGALGCEGHHEDIDGDLGGKGSWYVALQRKGQLRLRHRLVDRQRARWDALTPAQRAQWDASRSMLGRDR